MELLRNEGTVEILSGKISAPSRFIQTGSGKLTVRIAGSTPVTELSQLTFSGNAGGANIPALDGCLAVNLAPGFVPEIGQTFPALVFPRNPAGRFVPPIGRFVCFDYLTLLGQNRRLQPLITSSNVLLEVVVSSVEAPIIYTSLKAGNMRLCWGEEFPDFLLETCPDLSTLNWLNLPLPGVPDNDVSITVPLAEPHRFFRLKKPGSN